MDGRRTVNPNNKSSSSTAQDKSRITVSAEQSSGFREICNVRKPGWALRAPLLIDVNNRKGNKEFLLGKLIEGARSGYKADPVQLAKEIKEVRHEGGHLVFTTKEWRSSKHISSLFPRLTAAVQH